MKTVNKERLLNRMEEMAAIGSFDNGEGVHRLALSEEDVRARKLLIEWYEQIGLDYKYDAAGNMYGITKNTPEENPIVIGSHLDTVAYGGRFDGSLGVLAALETVQSIIESDTELKRPLVVANFTNEEGVRFTPDMMGSMFASGQCTEDAVHGATALDNGRSMGEELTTHGFLGTYLLQTPFAFIELHIEQGPVLETRQIDIGIVTGVTGIVWKEITIHGQANHAGTTPIELRKDAGLVTAKIIAYARDLSVETNGAVTVGRLEFEPNVTNIIPGKSKFTLDIRNTDQTELKECVNRMDYFLREMEHEHEVSIEQKLLVNVAPVDFDPFIIDAFEKAARTSGLKTQKMPSGAGHDAQLMAGCCPSGMIFIPSKGGISHHKLEYSSAEDCINGANVLLNTTLELLTK